MTRYTDADVARLPVAHYIGVQLPDGRHALARIDEDGVPLKPMRRILRCISEGRRGDIKPADYDLVAAWLDQQEPPCSPPSSPPGTSSP